MIGIIPYYRHSITYLNKADMNTNIWILWISFFSLFWLEWNEEQHSERVLFLEKRGGLTRGVCCPFLPAFTHSRIKKRENKMTKGPNASSTCVFISPADKQPSLIQYWLVTLLYKPSLTYTPKRNWNKDLNLWISFCFHSYWRINFNYPRGEIITLFKNIWTFKMLLFT